MRHHAVVDWVADFYARQYEWAGWPARWAAGDPAEIASMARTHVGAVSRLAGHEPKRILELGAGSGFTAAGLASAGHDVVAVELVDACVQSIRRLANLVQAGALDVVAGDFYDIEVVGPFDVVCYFDGFGIGSDDDQRRLLDRIQSWLSPQGCALVDVFAPWYWAGIAGTVDESPAGSGIYYAEGFDAEGCRMQERMWREGEEGKAVTQSLRCYAPADLRLLLATTDLRLASIEPYEDQTYANQAALVDAMLYLAKLELR